MTATVQLLREDQLALADRIFRLAFGTFLRLPDPMTFAGDADYVHTRWRADPTAALGATLGGELVGSNFAARWGSFGYFGPLSVRPDLWDRGVAQQLVAATIERFDAWELRHSGLFTFAESAKHVRLYQKFGFAPRFLTAIMSKPVALLSTVEGTPRAPQAEVQRFAELSTEARADILGQCRTLSSTIFEGLDVTREITAAHTQQLGDTLLMMDDERLTGFAVCHCGAGSEAGSGTGYVKFAAVGAQSHPTQALERLLGACHAFAAAQGMKRLIVGVNTARTAAYELLRAQRYRTEIQGVAMQRPNEAGFNRPDAYVLDDWR
jgi:GNAT superfamily N-acetyltransferase